MRDMGSIRERSTFLQQPVQLKAVWDVDADSEYRRDIVHARLRGLVAVYTIGGSGHISFNDRCFVTQPGSVLLFEHDEITGWRTNGDRWQFWWFEFSGQSDELPLYQVMSVDTQADDESLVEFCFDKIRSLDIYAASAASACFALMLFRWLASTDHEYSNNTHEHRIVERVVNYMHQNIVKPQGAADWAKTASLSPRRLRDIFKSVTGKSPKGHYDALRLKMALDMLVRGNTIEATAWQLCFSSRYHFTNAFRKYYGVSPSKHYLLKY